MISINDRHARKSQNAQIARENATPETMLPRGVAGGLWCHSLAGEETICHVLLLYSPSDRQFFCNLLLLSLSCSGLNSTSATRPHPKHVEAMTVKFSIPDDWDPGKQEHEVRAR
jgi:hypothetical protein